MSPFLLGFIVYLVLILVTASLTLRMNKTQADFLLAGRRLNVWVATLSERASGESAWLLLGLPAAAMTMGLVESWTVIGIIAGIGFSWWAVASGLRRETEKYQALTLPEYFARRFGGSGQMIRVVAALIIIFFYSFYVSAQFNGAGKVLHVTLDLPQGTGIAIGAVIIILYTMMGGFFAVAWTDVVQALIMFSTLVILPIVALTELSDQGLSLEASGTMASWTGGKTGWAAVAAIISGLSWGLGYSGQPHTVTRYMSFKKIEQIKKGRVVALVWAVPAFLGAMVIGLVGYKLYPAGTFTDSEQLMPFMATQLLPGWLAGIFVSGAIAAMMSTADSQLLVGTSAIAEDILHRGLGIELSPKRLVLMSRLVTLGLGAAGFLLALYSDKLIFSMVSYAWSGLGSSFGPAILLTLHWKKCTGRGVLAGMMTGAASTVIWSNIDFLENAISVRLVSFVLASLAIVIFSLLDSKSSSRNEGRAECPT
ncbi:MAG: sodium/proline symporter [Deltaproteobacteria bacterium]|nr:sodium/proline symporter [Deltaproteobacteria bacterium]